jgi:hypothetical protein
VEITRDSHLGPEDPLDLSLDVLPGPAGLAPGQARRELTELALRLGQRLVEADRLLVVQVLRVGDHDAPFLAEHGLGRLERAEPGEAGLTTR